jgi:transcriptional regulator with XRE-family HTH domain
MSQQKKLEIPERVRGFRSRAKLSQQELAERLGVTNNYISMIERGKKAPGSLWLRAFETLEQSPLYPLPGAGEAKAAWAEGAQDNRMLTLLSTDTLWRDFAEVAQKLGQWESPRQKVAIGHLRAYLDELEQRLLASSGALSEAQQIAMLAAKSDGHPEIK